MTKDKDYPFVGITLDKSNKKVDARGNGLNY